MNTKELIERIEGLNKLYGDNKNYVSYDDVLNLVKQLDKPQKVTIPQFVADLLSFAKRNFWDLEDVFEDVRNESRDTEMSKWFYQKKQYGYSRPCMA